MIQPEAYYAAHKTAPDPITLGRVGFAMIGREGELNPPLNELERFILNTIQCCNQWHDAKREELQQKWKTQKKDQRSKKKSETPCPPMSNGQQNVHQCPQDNSGQQNVHQCPQDNEVSTTSNYLPNYLSNYLSNKSVCDIYPPSHRLPDVNTVLTTAETMGVPREYAAWWYEEMTARGWTKTNGSRIDGMNWRPTLKAWYNKATPSELEQIAEKVKEAEAKKPKVYAAKDWILCQERCRHFQAGKCACGMEVPPQLRPEQIPPEECSDYQRI